MCFCKFRIVYKKESTAVKRQSKGQHHGLVCKQKMGELQPNPGCNNRTIFYD